GLRLAELAVVEARLADDLREQAERLAELVLRDAEREGGSVGIRVDPEVGAERLDPAEELGARQCARPAVLQHRGGELGDGGRAAPQPAARTKRSARFTSSRLRPASPRRASGGSPRGTSR